MKSKDIIKVEAGINGQVCIFLIPTTPLGTEVLKTINDKSKIQVVESTAAVYFGKTLPIGSIIISQFESSEPSEPEVVEVKESTDNNTE